MPNYYAIIPAEVRYDTELPDKAKLLYGEITALTNEKGYCWATNGHFAELYGCHEMTISKLIQLLIKKQYLYSEVIKDGYKTIRRLYISKKTEVDLSKNAYVEISENAEADLSNIVQLDLSKNAYVEISKNAEHNNKINNKRINNKSNNKRTNVPSSQLESEFEQLWKQYPRKDGKKEAKVAYFKARKDKTTYEEVENGIKRFINSLKNRGTQKEYIPMGSTWFNQNRWTDECTITVIHTKAKTPLELYRQEFGGNENEYSGSAQTSNVYEGGLPEFLQRKQL
jgi:hypothetical protein